MSKICIQNVSFNLQSAKESHISSNTPWCQITLQKKQNQQIVKKMVVFAFYFSVTGHSFNIAIRIRHEIKYSNSFTNVKMGWELNR